MRKEAGVTLIELMIAISLLAIVLTMGVPAYQTFVQNARATTQANELVTAINFTRAEAVKRGARVSICPSSDHANCNGGTDWTVGWMVFVDTSSGTGNPDVGEVLRVWDGPSGSATINGPQNVQFRAIGDVVTDPDDFSLEMANCTGDNAREITINAAGRPSVSRTACS